MDKIMKGVILRFVRSAVATGVPVLIQILNESKDPTLMLITPVLMALGKALRDKFGWEWLLV